MQLLRISKGRALLNAVIAFGMALGFNLFGAGFIGVPCVFVGLFFLLIIAVKLWNDFQRAMVGIHYQQTTFDEPEPTPRRSFGIYDPNDL